MAKAGTLTYNGGLEVEPQWLPAEKPLVKKSEGQNPPEADDRFRF